MTDQPIFENGFGWIESSEEKKYLHETLYGWSVFVPFVATSVEVINELPAQYRTWYNQGAKNACVGASTAQLMAMLNLRQLGPRQYDWWKHYCLACQIDHDNATSCQADIGTFLWSGLDVLRNNGAYVAGTGWVAADGIEQYLWVNPTRAVDDTRTALAESKLVSGASPWFEGFNPDRLEKKTDGRWWFPPPAKWGRRLGGHAYGWFDALDSAQAFGMANTWGGNYPDKVYMRYVDYEALHTRGAECAVLVDKAYVPPVPPPEPPIDDKLFIDVEWPIGATTYAGRLVEV